MRQMSTSVVRSPFSFEFGLFALFTVGLVLANISSLQWLAVVTVLLMAVWAYDISATALQRGLLIGSAPMYVAILAGVLSAYRFGAPGAAVALVGSTMLALTWSVARPHLRAVESITATTTLALAACFGGSSLILTRLRSSEDATVFLIIALAAILVAWLADRAEAPVVDPMIGMILGGLVAGLAASALFAPSVSSSVFASIAAVAGLVAGRTLGMLVRAGGYFGSSELPGSLGYFDGVVLASGAYWAVLTLVS